MTRNTTASGGSEQSSPRISPTTSAPHLPEEAAHDYICDMLAELTVIAEGANLKDLAALLRLTVVAARVGEA